MVKKRNAYEASFKAKVALAAVRGDKTLSELAGQFQLHACQVSEWKRKLLDHVDVIFRERGQRERHDEAAVQAELYQQIGRLKMELEWLKKKAARFDG